MVVIEKEYKGKIELTCSNCGKEYLKNRAWLKRTKKKYTCCSNKCRFEYHKKYANTKEFKKRVSDVHKGKIISEKHKMAITNKLSGKNNPSWKGGVTKKHRKGNYLLKEVMVKCPKKFSVMVRTNGYVLKHRLVMAKSLGRCLLSTEVVHHKDHNPENNILGNLMFLVRRIQNKITHLQH